MAVLIATADIDEISDHLESPETVILGSEIVIMNSTITRDKKEFYVYVLSNKDLFGGQIEKAILDGGHEFEWT